MQQTLDRPASDTEALADFAPKCSLVFERFLQVVKECENTAQWVGFTRCCGDSALICDEHYRTRGAVPVKCGRCKRMSDDLIGYQRL